MVRSQLWVPECSSCISHTGYTAVNLKQHPSASFRTHHRGESEAFPSLHLLLSPKRLFNGVGHEIEQIVRKRRKGRPNAMKFSYCSVQQWPGDHRWVNHTEQVLTHALLPRNTMLGLFKQPRWWRVSHAKTIFKQEVNNQICSLVVYDQYYNTLPLTGWLETAHVYSLTVDWAKVKFSAGLCSFQRLQGMCHFQLPDLHSFTGGPFVHLSRYPLLLSNHPPLFPLPS